MLLLLLWWQWSGGGSSILEVRRDKVPVVARDPTGHDAPTQLDGIGHYEKHSPSNQFKWKLASVADASNNECGTLSD